MVTRRSYFSIVILMAVITFLFLLPKIFEDYSISYYNDKIKDNIQVEHGVSVDKNVLSLASGEKTVAGKPLVYIFDNEDTSVYEEWCVYRKMQYRVIDSFTPCADEIPDYIVVGRFDYTENDTEIFRSYLENGTNIIFTQMPDYQNVTGDKDYMELLGILKCRQENVNVEELHIFNDFFVSKERIYSNRDFYGDKNKFKMEIPYYELRAGYQVFAQAKIKDTEYLDYPPVLWRTYTDNGYVFVVNTDVFEGKGVIGLLTAFVSQCESYDVYPVVNAQTVSVINFPVMNNENEELFEATYDRDMHSFSRDILWPGISTILQNYNKSYNFFMAAKLDYSTEKMSNNPDLGYYYSEIVSKLGTLGVSYDQVSDVSLSTINETVKSEIQKEVEEYNQIAAYVPESALGEEDCVKNGKSNIILTDMSDERPIIEKEEDGTIRTCFTSSGVDHNIRQDLSLVGIETALGLDMQSTNIKEVLFKNDDTYWEKVSSTWASETTYIKDFEEFDTVSVEESMGRISNFLVIDYKTERLADNSISVHITSDSNSGYFVVRLWNEQITGMSSGSFEKVNDTTYLISVVDKDTVIYTKQRK